MFGKASLLSRLTTRNAGKVRQITVGVSVTFCLIIGTLIFCRGYLLNRKVITDKSSRGQAECAAGQNTNCSTADLGFTFKKTVLVLVDALRYDFLSRMKFLSQKLNSNDAGSFCPFKFIADPPTTTMQRLKALMTGTMPTFIDVSASFNSYEIDEDSLIHQFYKAGYKIGFLGDDTWLSLFSPKYFTSKFVEGHPSFNAWDLDTVDYAINSTLHSILSDRNNDKDWDVLITHYLGVDHCGHRYGPNHNEMVRKLDEIDTTIQFIFNSMDSDTLLVVFGDHGMTVTGDHGGDSTDEVQSALVFLTKQKAINCKSNLQQLLSVQQTDLVPTLATLLKVPIPYSSIGKVIPNLLPEDVYSEAILKNVVQVHNYIQAYGFPADVETAALDIEYENTLQGYEQYKLNTNSSTQEELHRLCSTYLNHVKRIAVSIWTQFDYLHMSVGLLICVLSLAALFLTIQNSKVLQPEYQPVRYLYVPLLSTVTYILFLQFETYYIMVITTVGLIYFIRGSIAHLKRNKKDTDLNQSTIQQSTFNFGSIIPCMLYGFTSLAVFSNSFLINEGSILGYALLFAALFHCMSCDSGTMAELTRKFGRGTGKKLTNKTKSRVWHSWFGLFGLVLIVRSSQIFFRCREELTTCTEEFLLHKQLSTLPTEWIVHKYIRYSLALISLAVFVVSFRNWMLARKCINSSRPSAIIGKYIPSILVVLICVYWALQGLPLDQLIQSQIRPVLHYFPSVFQMIALTSLGILWWKPLCCIGQQRHLIDEKNRNSHKNNHHYDLMDNSLTSDDESNANESNGQRNEETSLQNGCKNVLQTMEQDNFNVALDEMSNDVYSSSLLTYGIIVTLLLVHITSIGLTPVMTFIPYAIACLIVIYGKSTNPGSWSSVISWTIASQYFFYATGHQPIFSAIPWDSAFITDNSNDLSDVSSLGMKWIRPTLAVFGNIHVSQIIFSVSLPLLIFWKYTSLKPQMRQLRRENLHDLGTKFIILHGLKLLACMMCVTIHRRHLMVWKIFTPKFIFEGVSFVVIYVVVFVSILFILRVDYLLEQALINRRKTLS